MLSFGACLQTAYEDNKLDYYPPAAGDIPVNFSAAPGSDMLIVTISNGMFQQNIEASNFQLSGSGVKVPALNVPLRDSDTRVIFSFDSNTAEVLGGNYWLTIKKEALKEAANRAAAQAVKSGTWTTVTTGMDGLFGRSPIRAIGYGNGRYVAVADGGKMAYSNDGLAWTAIQPGYSGIQSQFIDAIYGIVWGGSFFVAAGAGGRMGTSDNGISWQGWSESMFGDQSILSVTYGGGRFVAGGSRGKIIFMQDGGNWTSAQDSQFGDNAINALAWGNPGGQNIYVAAGKDGRLSWSYDAINWTYSDSAFAGSNILGLAWGNGCFVAVGDGGKISFSTDGRLWQAVSFGSERPFDITKSIQCVTYGSGIFIAADNDGRMAKSADGQSWERIGTANTPFSPGWAVYAAGYGGGKFIAAGYLDTLGTSRMVLGYQAPEVIAAPSDLQSLPFSSTTGDNRLVITITGGKFTDFLSPGVFSILASAGSGGYASGALTGSVIDSTDTRIVISLDNSALSNGSGQIIQAQAAAFALMPSLMEVRSEKALDWILASSNPFGNRSVTGIAYGNGKYVAVGEGMIATSSDGKTWTENTSGYNLWTADADHVLLRDVVFGNNKFMAVGYWVNGGDYNDSDGSYAGWGVVLTSADGNTWISTDKILSFTGDAISPRIFTIAHNGVSGAGSEFIVGGQWGRCACLYDNSNSWAQESGEQIYPFDYMDVLSIAYGDGKFAAVGQDGKAAWSDDGGADWNWTANKLLGESVNINTVYFGNGSFIAAGDGGNMKIVPSSGIAPASGSINGGENWLGVDSKFAGKGILALAYDGVRFIAAGHNGRMSESYDGANWIVISPGTGTGQDLFGTEEKIYCVTWDGGKFIAGGNAYNDNSSKLIYSE